jgi:hypothetical protein
MRRPRNREHDRHHGSPKRNSLPLHWHPWGCADTREMDSDASDSTTRHRSPEMRRHARDGLGRFRQHHLCLGHTCEERRGVVYYPEMKREKEGVEMIHGKTIKKDKGTQSPRDRPCAVVVEPASPSRDAGPPVRTTREVFKRLVATLDSVLPTDFRSVPCPNGAGARSLGNAGRSSHDVLADAVRFVAAHRHKLDQQAMLTERVSLMQTMLRSRGAITVEVETFDCIIAAMSPGAENFFKDAPWGNMIGQSLRDFVQWEDLDNFNSLMNPVGLPIEDRACTIRLIHFAVSDFPPLQQHIATSPFAESALDYEDEALILVRDSSADGWSDAFEHDPMLCDHAENNSSTHKPHLLGNYVKTSFQVLRTSNAPQSALVAITLL